MTSQAVIMTALKTNQNLPFSFLALIFKHGSVGEKTFGFPWHLISR